MEDFNITFSEKSINDFSNVFGKTSYAIKEISNDYFHFCDEKYIKESNYSHDEEYHYVNMTYNEFKRRIKTDKRKVLYKLNKNFFRCENFKKDHEGVHILFAGCSETFGEGGNIENNWTKLVYDKLKENNNLSGYFNLGKSGASYEQIINYINLYIKEFSKPDIIAIVFPNLVRSYVYDLDENIWNINVRTGPIKKEKEYFEIYSNRFAIWAVSLTNFINYCSSIDIKVIWSTWAFNENNNIINSKMFEDSFLPISSLNIDKIDIDFIDEDIRRRDGHRGNLWHKYVADKFIDAICENNLIAPENKYNPTVEEGMG